MSILLQALAPGASLPSLTRMARILDCVRTYRLTLRREGPALGAITAYDNQNRGAQRITAFRLAKWPTVRAPFAP
jgi:hypothetical protein